VLKRIGKAVFLTLVLVTLNVAGSSAATEAQLDPCLSFPANAVQPVSPGEDVPANLAAYVGNAFQGTWNYNGFLVPAVIYFTSATPTGVDSLYVSATQDQTIPFHFDVQPDGQLKSTTVSYAESTFTVLLSQDGQTLDGETHEAIVDLVASMTRCMAPS